MAGYGKPLTDDDVVEAQRRDRLSHDMEGVGDAISSAFMRKAVAAEKPYSEADALEQRGQMQDKSVARARAADDDDPTSPASRALQATFAKLHPEAAEYAPGLSFRKIVQLAPHMREYAKPVEKPLTPPPLAQVNIKELDPQQKEKTAAEIELLRARTAAASNPRPTHGSNPLDDELKRAKLAKLNAPPGEHQLTEREKIQRAKFERDNKRTDVPGFEDSDPDHAHPLSQENADELRKAATARDYVLKNIAAIRKIRAANPNALPTSSAMADIKAIIAETQGSIASLNDFNLTSGHQELQHEMLDDPAKALAYLNSGRLDAQLNRLEHTANTAVDTRAAHMQRRRAAQGQPQGHAAPADQAGAETKVVGGVTYTKNARGKWEAEE